MKISAVLPAVLSLTLLCAAQSARSVPLGIRHAQELEAQSESPLPDSASSRINPLALSRGRRTGQSGCIRSAERAECKPGLLEKDLIRKLKQIEKLSKHLRSELAR